MTSFLTEAAAVLRDLRTRISLPDTVFCIASRRRASRVDVTFEP